MSDDAQTPGSGYGAVPPRTSLEKPERLERLEKAGSGESAGWAAPSVHDQQTVTSMPSAGTPHQAVDAAQGSGMPVPPPWVNPSTGPNPATPMNGPGGSFAPPADPFAPPSAAPPTPSGNPFAPPTAPYASGEPVPPPPIAPDGPGQVPYGYPGYGYPPAGGYGWPGLQPVPSNGLGTAGLVLGIISAAVFCLWPVAIVLGVLALIFGTIGRGKARRGEATNPGQALAGIICGAAGVVFGFVMLAFVIATR